MTRDLALSLHRQGDNGSQILQILETIANPSDSDSSMTQPTAEAIQF